MANKSFWKVTIGLIVFGQCQALLAQVGTLSEGACWYDWTKEELKVASFNDKTVYKAPKAQIEGEVEALINNHQKIQEMDLMLHCGGYGASLVAKVSTESGNYCLWTRFEKGKLVARSLGVLGEKNAATELCDGRKSGEFILGVNSKDFIADLQGPKYAGMIKEIVPVTEKVYKVVLVSEYAQKEYEVIAQLEENFAGKNFIRYIEFNEYHHPVGEYTQLK